MQQIAQLNPEGHFCVCPSRNNLLQKKLCIVREHLWFMMQIGKGKK